MNPETTKLETIHGETLVTHLIKMENIKTKYLKELYKGEGQKAWLSYNQVKNDKKYWEKEYEHDAILAFWLAIDRGDITFLRSLLDWDISFRYIACLAYYKKKEKSKDTF